jgi:SAM-dependent methyltransferase
MNDDPKKSTSIDLARFQTAYSEHAPWDIGKPQLALEAVADEITGSILYAGCGTGENALFFAAKDHDVTGFDFFEGAIATAKRKAEERGLDATFLVEDALNLQNWTAQFDNVIDCGLFHVFSDEDRIRYVRGIEMVLERAGNLYLLCFSERTPGTVAARRVTQNELIATFHEGWEIESIEPARFEVRPEMREQNFGGADPHAWFMVAGRTPSNSTEILLTCNARKCRHAGHDFAPTIPSRHSLIKNCAAHP